SRVLFRSANDGERRVDDGAALLERCIEHDFENRDRPILEVVFDASLEVRSAVVYATFAVVLVFVPVLTMSGLAGRLFAPMALAYIFAILASLAVALTVTPALSMILLRGRVLEREERGWLSSLKDRYRALLLRVEEHPYE